jgi:hypothetical protein
MAYVLKIDFLRSRDPVALAKGRLIRTMLTNHPYHKEPLPTGVLSPDQLGELIERLQTAYDQALSRDVGKIEIRKRVRAEFNRAMRNLARHLEIFANGDPALLQNTGFDTQGDRKKKVAQVGPLPKPIIEVVHGPRKGTLLVHIKLIIGAVIYELYLTAGDPTKEENWSKYGAFVHPSKIIVEGLISGQNYWLRARGIGETGEGTWSAPFPIMSL